MYNEKLKDEIKTLYNMRGLLLIYTILETTQTAYNSD